MHKDALVWKIEKEKLLDLVALLELIPTRPGIPSSEYIKLTGKGEKLRLQISSEIEGEFSLQGEGEWPFKQPWFVDRRMLFPFIQVSTNGKSNALFEFHRIGDEEMKGREMLVKHGTRRVTFSKQHEIPGYADFVMPADKQVLRLSKGSLSLIACARECASGDPTTPELNCVFIVPSRAEKALSILASNTRIVYGARHVEEHSLKDCIPMPLFLVRHLTNPGLKKIYCTKKAVILYFENGKLWQTTSKKSQDFPVKDVEAYLASKMHTVTFIEGKAFALTVQNIGSYLAAVRRQDWVLQVSGKKGDSKLVLESTVPQCRFKEILHSATVKEDFELLWPLDMLLPVFDHVASGKEDRLSILQGSEGHTILRTKHISLLVTRKRKKGKRNE